MKIISPSVEIWPVDTTDPYLLMRHIERAGRVCYKSESLISNVSHINFIVAVINRNHTAVLEHGNLTLEVSGDTENYLKNVIKSRPKFFALTPIIDYPKQRYIGSYVTANIRAWREALAYAVEYSMPYEMPEPLLHCLSEYGVLFEDILPKPKEKDRQEFRMECKVIDPRSIDDPIIQRLHETFTLKFICDRGVSHEIVRHRLASYCQESTRYCNYSKEKFSREITVIKPCFWKEDSENYNNWKTCCKVAEETYFEMMEDGKTTAQEARSVLPNSLKTELVMTATAEEWRWFLKLRTDDAAHPQMQEVAKMAYALLVCKAPELFEVL